MNHRTALFTAAASTAFVLILAGAASARMAPTGAGPAAEPALPATLAVSAAESLPTSGVGPAAAGPGALLGPAADTVASSAPRVSERHESTVEREHSSTRARTEERLRAGYRGHDDDD